MQEVRQLAAVSESQPIAAASASAPSSSIAAARRPSPGLTGRETCADDSTKSLRSVQKQALRGAQMVPGLAGRRGRSFTVEETSADVRGGLERPSCLTHGSTAP